MKKNIYSLTLILLLVNIGAKAQTAMTLQECVQYSLKNHAANTIASNDIVVAEQKASEALAGYLPQVNGSVTFDDNLKLPVTIIPAGAFSPTETRIQFGNQYNTNATVQLDQTIYDQSMIYGIKASAPNTALAQLRKVRSSEDLMYNTVKSYYQVMVYQERERILVENEKKYQSLLEIMNVRVQQGVARSIDYDRIKVGLNNILSQKSVLQTGKLLSMNTLKYAMGMPLTSGLEIEGALPALTNIKQPARQEIDVTKRIDYQIQSVGIELQEIDVMRKKAAYLPTLTAYARYGAQTFGNAFSKAFDTWVDFASIGLKLNVPIFGGFRKSSQLSQSELNVENEKLQQKLNIENLKLQALNSGTEREQSYASLSTNKENFDLAKSVYETTTLEYQKGVASLTDLLNADYAYKEAESNYVNSMLSYLTAQLDYEKSKGTLSTYINTL